MRPTRPIARLAASLILAATGALALTACEGGDPETHVEAREVTDENPYLGDRPEQGINADMPKEINRESFEKPPAQAPEEELRNWKPSVTTRGEPLAEGEELLADDEGSLAAGPGEESADPIANPAVCPDAAAMLEGCAEVDVWVRLPDDNVCCFYDSPCKVPTDQKHTYSTKGECTADLTL